MFFSNVLQEVSNSIHQRMSNKYGWNSSDSKPTIPWPCGTIAGSFNSNGCYTKGRFLSSCKNPPPLKLVPFQFSRARTAVLLVYIYGSNQSLFSLNFIPAGAFLKCLLSGNNSIYFSYGITFKNWSVRWTSFKSDYISSMTWPRHHIIPSIQANFLSFLYIPILTPLVHTFYISCRLPSPHFLC